MQRECLTKSSHRAPLASSTRCERLQNLAKMFLTAYVIRGMCFFTKPDEWFRTLLSYRSRNFLHCLFGCLFNFTAVHKRHSMSRIKKINNIFEKAARISTTFCYERRQGMPFYSGTYLWHLVISYVLRYSRIFVRIKIPLLSSKKVTNKGRKYKNYLKGTPSHHC